MSQFHYFEALPKELRLDIWQMATINNTARIMNTVEIVQQDPEQEGRLLPEAKLSCGWCQREVGESLDHEICFMNAINYGLWNACPESREVVRRLASRRIKGAGPSIEQDGASSLADHQARVEGASITRYCFSTRFDFVACKPNDFVYLTSDYWRFARRYSSTWVDFRTLRHVVLEFHYFWTFIAVDATEMVMKLYRLANILHRDAIIYLADYRLKRKSPRRLPLELDGVIHTANGCYVEITLANHRDYGQIPASFMFLLTSVQRMFEAQWCDELRRMAAAGLSIDDAVRSDFGCQTFRLLAWEPK